MKKNFRRLTSVLLAVVLVTSVFSILPVQAASDDNQSVCASSGTTGDCTWVLDDEGTLTISGNGKMADYDDSAILHCGPWGNSITAVIINNGVTNIGYSAFYGCKNLISVTIPDSVTSIGIYSFDGCYNLTDIIIPESVDEIGRGAFYSCINLTSINIPDKVKVIESLTFRNCEKLDSIIIPDKVTCIGDCAFQGTGLKSVIIPDSVTEIGGNAFQNCKSLNNITISDNLEKLGRKVFDDTAWLEKQPDGLIYAGKVVCKYKGVCPESIEIQSGTIGFAELAFYESNNEANNLKSITIPNSVTQIGLMAIGYYRSLNGEVIKTPNFKICGYNGSAAQTYANDNGFTFIDLNQADTEKPTVLLSSTNNVEASQNVTLSLSDNVGIKGYYWGTNSNYLSNVYTETSSISVSKTVDTNGTYYATAVDTSGNVSDTKSITFYKTTLNANGGSVSPTSVLTKSGNSFTFPTPTRSGNYVYNGWSTASSATSGVKSLTPSSNTTYYALWKTNEINDSFVWGQDNWKFDNTSRNFKNYNVNSTVFNLMKQDFNLSNSQAYELNQAIKEDNSYGFGGSCFGMTVSEIMAKHGDLKLSRYGGNDIVSSNSNTSNMTSVINFIQELQSVSGYSQNIRQAPFMSGSHSQYDFIDKAEAVLTNEKVFVKLSYGIMYLNKNTGKYSPSGYHAVLGYGIENCNYYSSVTGKTYDKRILIADPNHLSHNSLYGDSCIYYKSTDHSWICPYWNENGSSYAYSCYWNASSGSSTNTGFIRNIMKYDSLTDTVDLMSDYSVSHYISGVTIENISGNSTTVEQIQNTGNPDLDYAGGANSGIAQYNIEMDDSYNVKENEEFYALWNPTANYSVSYTKPSDFNLKMDYESIMYYANVKNGMYSLFKPNGSIQLRGSDATYSITMVTDDSECVTDWFALNVSGNDTDNLTFSKQSNGYVLNSSNLNNIKVSASNNDVEATRTFSTNYNSVFIYEIDENTIGLKVDTDNNGTYETELAASDDTLTIGDANGDNNIDILDATLAQKYAVGKANLTEEQLAVADVNGDGIVDILDAAEIQKFAAGIITEFKKKG